MISYPARWWPSSHKVGASSLMSVCANVSTPSWSIALTNLPPHPGRSSTRAQSVWQKSTWHSAAADKSEAPGDNKFSAQIVISLAAAESSFETHSRAHGDVDFYLPNQSVLGVRADMWERAVAMATHPSGGRCVSVCEGGCGAGGKAAGVHSRPSFVPVLWKKHCKGGGGEKERTTRFSGEDIMIENYVEMITEHAASHCSGYIICLAAAESRRT